MNETLLNMSGAEITAAIRAGTASARQVTQSALARIEERSAALGAFTDVTAARALAQADKVDAKRAKGETLGSLAGVPFAVKNLFDIAGLPTRAGSRINRELAPARADATLVQRLEAADAVLLGGLNMGEYAYDFTGENVQDGPSRNPHDPAHMTGGSSGGSGAAVAGGLVAMALGSDTNGSIRVPASFCGLFGLKPTYGRLSRAGSFPFVASFDHLGPLARSVADLALSYDAMQGADPADPAQAHMPVHPAFAGLEGGIGDLRIARLGGYFSRMGEAAAFDAVHRIAAAFGTKAVVELPEAGIARSAGYLITMVEGAALHLDRLKTRRTDFDPDVSNRLLAGAMLPGHWVTRAQKFRSWFRAQAAEVFRHHDILIAPATPTRAPRLGQKTMVLDGQEMLVRPNIGIFTQPISFIGLPVVTVPLWTAGERLPIGVQLIGAPWCDEKVLRAARFLERQGVCHAPVAAFGGRA